MFAIGFVPARKCYVVFNHCVLAEACRNLPLPWPLSIFITIPITITSTKLEIALRRNDECISPDVRFCFVTDHFHLILLQFLIQKFSKYGSLTYENPCDPEIFVRFAPALTVSEIRTFLKKTHTW